MRFISRSPVYNLKAVLNETGLKADVLRAWERRYGLPTPERTAGGHRLYSEYDVETIKWLHARQAEGLSISRATELWHELIEAGRDPLTEYGSTGTMMVSDPSQEDTRLSSFREEWLNANMAFDSMKADEVLNQAFALYPVEIVCKEILQRGLSTMGEYWYQDKATVQQEHFATAQAIRRLDSLITATPNPTIEKTVLVGCPPGEWHSFPVLLLTLFLRRRGLDAVYLGANIPIEQLVETMDSIKPDMIVMAAQRLPSAASLLFAAFTLRKKDIIFGYGGQIFNRIPELREQIPGIYLGDTIEGSLFEIERLLTIPNPSQTAARVTETREDLVELYRENRPLIETELYKIMEIHNGEIDHFQTANEFFGDELIAAMALGNPAYMEADLEWVQKLMTRRRIPAKELIPYLIAYREAVGKVIGREGAIITKWISDFIAKNDSQ